LKLKLSESNPICFVATSSPSKAKIFYQNVLGLSLLGEDQFAMVFNLKNDIMLRVQKVEEVSASGYTTLGWEVDSIIDTIKHLVSKGVRFERYDKNEDEFHQDELGVWTSPGGHKIAWFKDPDGNTLSLTEFSA